MPLLLLQAAHLMLQAADQIPQMLQVAEEGQGQIPDLDWTDWAERSEMLAAMAYPAEASH